MSNPLISAIALVVCFGFAMGAVRWIQRKAADLRGHRLPLMGMR